MYSKRYLNIALYLRSKVRRKTFDAQVGTMAYALWSFLEVLFDIRHQETFSNTILHKYAQKDIDLLAGFIPKQDER
jgi:hypothetical protein